MCFVSVVDKGFDKEALRQVVKVGSTDFKCHLVSVSDSLI